LLIYGAGDLNRQQALPGEEGGRQSRPRGGERTRRQQDRHGQEGGPLQPRPVGQGREPVPGRHRLGLGRDHADELRRHPFDLRPAAVQLQGGDEPVVELRHLLLGPPGQRVERRHLQAYQQPVPRRGEEAELPGGHDQPKEKRRVNVPVDDPVGEAGERQRRDGERDPPGGAPGEAVQPLAALPATELADECIHRSDLWRTAGVSRLVVRAPLAGSRRPFALNSGC
jgi:hypothetical protein